jgi:hypothetical protein
VTEQASFKDSGSEAGSPTLWDNAWREGHAHGLMDALGVPYRTAWQATVRMAAGHGLGISTGTSTLNARGEWVPAIPLPLFAWPHRYRCSCRRWFWTMNRYRGHYAVTHLLEGRAT